jgi:Xaa-Pro dipeptidase
VDFLGHDRRTSHHEFAHAHFSGEKDLTRIHPRNPESMRNPDAFGRERHWILEIHLVD